MIITNGYNDVHFLPSRTVQLGSGEFSSSSGSPQSLFLSQSFSQVGACVCVHNMFVCECERERERERVVFSVCSQLDFYEPQKYTLFLKNVDYDIN